MKYMQLKSELNKCIKGGYAIIGDDLYLKSRAVQIFKNRCINFSEDFNYIKLDFTKMDINNLDPILSTLPMGNDIRMVVLENASINAELGKLILKQIDYTAENEGVCLLLLNPTVYPKDIEVIDCNHLDKYNFEKWILSHLANKGYTIEKSALEYMIEISNCDLTYLTAELSKITTYCVMGKKVTLDAVQKLMTINESYFSYNLTNAIDKKNIKAIATIVNALTEKDNIGNIFAYIGTYFRRMFYCSISSENDEALATYLKVKPYAIKKSKEAVQKNGKQYYIDLYNKYVSLDYKIKNGDISAFGAFYELVLSDGKN